MKTSVLFSVIACSLALSACASMRGPAPVTKSDTEIDFGKVIAVNDWAVRRHAAVMWVNYPKRPRERAGEG